MAQVKPAMSALIVVVVVVGLAGAPVGASTAPIWTARYNGPGLFDNAASVAVSPDGTKVFVTGSSVGSTGNSDYFTIAYEAATGLGLWTKRYDGPGGSDDLASSVAVSPDNSKVFVTGWSIGSTGNYDYATIAYDATTGANAWLKRYNGPGNGFDSAYSVAVSQDGLRVFVTGASAGSGTSRDFPTLAYDVATGNNAWFKRFSSPGSSDDVASSVAVSPNSSNVFVTGGSFASTGNLDYTTIAYNAATGNNMWMRGYNGPANSSDFAYSIAVSPDNTKVFVTGSRDGSGSTSDYATIAYNAVTGANVWFQNYNGPGNGNDVAYSIAVSPNGSKVFVTGGSLGSTGNWDYATIAYDLASGGLVWEERYNGPGNRVDYGSSVAVSPDSSKVFVTGSSDGAGGTFDYATIAYQA